MKKQSPRSRPTRPTAPYPARHQLDHVVPTVIHDPEEKMTALGRFTRRALQQPRKYLGWPAAVLGGLFLIVVIWKLATGGPSASSEVWAKLETAKTPQERLDLAKQYPKSPAASWALLQAGTEYYNQALADLPQNRDVALPTAKKALDAFEQVERAAPPDSVQARAAALGKARALELRGELAKAIEQYELVARTWPGTIEAEEAQRYADALRDPQAAAFYKELYAYSPTKMTLPPLGTERISSPAPGSSGPAPTTQPGTTPAAPAGVPDIPAIEPTPPGVREVQVQPKTPGAKAKAQPDSKATPPPAKAEPSQPAGAPPELPADVFSPR